MGNYLWLILMEMLKSNQGRDISHAKLIMTLPLLKETYLAGFVTVISIYHNLLFIGLQMQLLKISNGSMKANAQKNTSLVMQPWPCLLDGMEEQHSSQTEWWLGVS